MISTWLNLESSQARDCIGQYRDPTWRSNRRKACSIGGFISGYQNKNHATVSRAEFTAPSFRDISLGIHHIPSLGHRRSNINMRIKVPIPPSHPVALSTRHTNQSANSPKIPEAMTRMSLLGTSQHFSSSNPSSLSIAARSSSLIQRIRRAPNLATTPFHTLCGHRTRASTRNSTRALDDAKGHRAALGAGLFLDCRCYGGAMGWWSGDCSLVRVCEGEGDETRNGYSGKWICFDGEEASNSMTWE